MRRVSGNDFLRVCTVLCIIQSLPLGASASDCHPTASSHGPAYANFALGPFLGSSVGQVFLAPQTEIDSIVVWRPSNSVSSIGAHLYILATDAASHSPQTGDVLLDGPTVVSNVIDSTGYIRVPFVLAPHFDLPAPGYYAIFFQPQDCWQGEPWRLLVDWNGPSMYADGDLWETNRSQNSCGLFLPSRDDFYDLIFSVYFCDSTTPTLRHTWGELKSIYR
jgi:hypothetical protein